MALFIPHFKQQTKISEIKIPFVILKKKNLGKCIYCILEGRLEKMEDRKANNKQRTKLILPSDI